MSCYLAGKGTNRDLVEACKWLLLSETGDMSDQAKKMREEFVLPEMTQREIARAEKLAREFRIKRNATSAPTTHVKPD